MMDILITIGWIVIAVVVVLRSGMFVVVPAVHFGVVTRFGNRKFGGGKKGRVLEEGLNIVWPFIDKVELISGELVTKSIEGSSFSKDTLEIIFKGSVQWRPDKELLRTKFIEMDESTVLQGINDAVNNALGILAGTKPGKVFIENRGAIADMINCMLRLGNPPHCDLIPSKWLAYYKTHSAETRVKLGDEAGVSDDKSEIESRYGIDIVTFELSDVDFSPATKKALELKQQEAGRLQAVALTQETKLKLIKEYVDSGLDIKEATLAAEVTMTQAERIIIDGNLGALGAVAKKLITNVRS